MLNAVLWLSGICLCQALPPDFKSCWDLNRKPSNLWPKPFYTIPFNISQPFNMWPYPCYKPWSGVPGSVLRPSLPLYSHNQNSPFLSNIPFVKKFPMNLSPNRVLQCPVFPSQFIHGIDKDLPLPESYILNTIPTPIKNNNFRPEDEVILTDYHGKLNDSCLRISHNETMVISPSILIGRKNKSCLNDNWILSNEPVNILVKKCPKTDILRIDNDKCKVKHFLVRTSPRYSLKQSKNISKKNYENVFYEEEYEVTPTEEDIAADYSKINDYDKTATDYELSTDYDPFDNLFYNSHERLPNTNNKSILSITSHPVCKQTHPIKKKVTIQYKLESPYNYEINDDLSVNEGEAREYESLKKLNPNNDLTKKIKRAVILKKTVKNRLHPKKKITYNNFSKHIFANLRPKSKLIKRRAVMKNIKNKKLYVNDPRSDVNYYDYVIGNKNSDYADVDIVDPLSINDYINYIPIRKSNRFEQDETSFDDVAISTTSISINMLNQFEDNKLSKGKIYKPRSYSGDLFYDKRTRGNRSKPVKNKTISNLKDSEHVHGYSKSNQASKLTCSSRDLIIKNLTDELSQKMVLLSNLTLENLLSSNHNQNHVNNQSIFQDNVKGHASHEIISSTPVLWSSIKRSHAPLSVEHNREDHVFDEMFVSPNKLSCELHSQHRCACSPLGMIKFFSNEIKKSLDAKVLLKKLITYSCEEYFPIELHYCIASDMKPRLISKKRKELIEDKDCGPKEITPIYFEELLMRGIPREGVDIYVFPSTTVEIPCFSSDEMKLSPNIADSALYRWSHSNLKAITEGRILEDANHRGSLIIQDVMLADSDNYTCSVHYVDPDSQVTVMRTFIHAVKVVVLPRLALHTNLHYVSSQKCDQELLEMFELYLPQQIQTSICSLGKKDDGRSICSVEIHNPVCYTRNKQDEPKRPLDPRLLWRTDFQKSRWIREILNEDIQEMEMSLNYELDLGKVSEYVPESLNWSHCSPHCQQKISLKTIEILRDSFLDALLLPVKSHHQNFEPVLSSVNIKLLTACDGGLELKEGFCVPCQKHFYSEHGRTICVPCPLGTYQDNIGAKSCIPCPHPFRPNCFYMWNFRNMIWVLLVIMTIISFLWICWLCCIRFRRKKIVMRCCTGKKVKLKLKKPEPLPPDFE